MISSCNLVCCLMQCWSVLLGPTRVDCVSSCCHVDWLHNATGTTGCCLSRSRWCQDSRQRSWVLGRHGGHTQEWRQDWVAITAQVSFADQQSLARCNACICKALSVYIDKKQSSWFFLPWFADSWRWETTSESAGMQWQMHHLLSKNRKVLRECCEYWGYWEGTASSQHSSCVSNGPEISSGQCITSFERPYSQCWSCSGAQAVLTRLLRRILAPWQIPVLLWNIYYIGANLTSSYQNVWQILSTFGRLIQHHSNLRSEGLLSSTTAMAKSNERSLSLLVKTSGLLKNKYHWKYLKQDWKQNILGFSSIASTAHLLSFIETLHSSLIIAYTRMSTT